MDTYMIIIINYHYNLSTILCLHKKACLIAINIGSCIMLTACQSDFANGVLWNATKQGESSSVRCSSLHPNFRYGMRTRSCKNGGWSSVSIRDCTMHSNSHSVIIVSITTLEMYNQQYYLQLAENVSLNVNFVTILKFDMIYSVSLYDTAIDKLKL